MGQVRASSPITDENVHKALSLWADGEGSPSPLEPLLLWQKARARQSVTSPLGATEIVLQDALDALAAEQAEYARLLRLRFADGEPGYRIAATLHMAEGTVWRKQREAIALLTEILREQDDIARDERRRRFGDRLGAQSYSQLFGVDKHADVIVDQLLLAHAPWLIAISGIGGIGKTSLADVVTRRMLEESRWHDFAWVTARREDFGSGGAIKPIERPALTTEALMDGLAQQLLADDVDVLSSEQKRNLLKERLHARPHLIVIDNLETLLDIESLLATAGELANPSKFLFTSRNNRIYQPDLFLYTVTELDPDDALALVRAEARLRNLPSVAAATDDALMPIVDTVGGNPLALRLVVGRLHVHPLARVLDDLRSARGHHASEIYTFIFYRIWQELDETARRVLLLMPLVASQGGDIEYLTAVGAHGGLTSADVGDALDRLVARNLVDSRGDLHERRFTIHALTHTFLQQQVLQWQVDGNEQAVAMDKGDKV